MPEVGANQEFTELVFGSKKGAVVQPVPVGGTKFVVAVVSDIFPTHQAEFEEVAGQIRESVIAERANQLATRKAEELAAKAKSMNGDLRKAAQSLGLQVKTSEEVTRNGAIEGVGSVSMLQDAFTKPAGTLAGPVAVADARVVYKVVGRVQADTSQLAAQRDTIRDEIKSTKARQRNTLFEDSVKQALKDQGKIKIYQDAVQRLMSNYAG
jgi:peptidyl-prolyl cis-trans isomerase D